MISFRATLQWSYGLLDEDERARLVVGEVAVADPCMDCFAHGRVERELGAFDGHVHRALREPLPIGDRLRDHVGHHRPALHLGTLRRLGAARGHTREQLRDRDEPDALLTE